jgi:CBS domain-containing protein
MAPQPDSPKLASMRRQSGGAGTEQAMTPTSGTAEQITGERFAGVLSDEATVGEVMHPGLIFCAPESPARQAARLMARYNVHAVVVLGDDEEGGLWGIVSDSGLVSFIARRELDEHTAGGMARTPLVTVCRSDSIARAAELMCEHRVTHLLVLVGRRPVGVVSTLDLARAAAEGLDSETGA